MTQSPSHKPKPDTAKPAQAAPSFKQSDDINADLYELHASVGRTRDHRKLTPNDVLVLQRTVGNQAVMRMMRAQRGAVLSPTLRISSPHIQRADGDQKGFAVQVQLA